MRPAIIILFTWLLFLVNPNLLVAFTYPPQNPESWADKVLGKLSFEDKVGLLLWTNQEGNSKSIGGRICNSPDQVMEENKNTLSYSVINIYDGFEAPELSAIPFPSKTIRGFNSKKAIELAHLAYKPDFILDFPPQKGVAFYGITFEGTHPVLTPHFKSDSLNITLTNYDQIWWLSDIKSAIEQLTGGKKPSKKLRNLVNDRARKSLVKKAYVHKNTNKSGEIEIDEYTRWAWKKYSTSISLINNPANLPIRILEDNYFCTVTLNQESFDSFRRHLDFYVSHSYYPNALDFETPYNLKRLANYDYLMVPASSITATQLSNLNKLSEKLKLVLVWYGNDRPPIDLSTNITQILVEQHNGVTEAIVPQLIFGALGFSSVQKLSYAPSTISTYPIGRLQFGPPALANLDTEVLSRIDTMVENGIIQQAMPGSQVLVAKNGIVVYYQNFGYKTYDRTSAIEDYHLYDLASLTKVMATTQAIMFLAERGMLDLDVPIAHYLPEMWDSDKAFVPVREIMAHQAGLYPYIPFWKQVLPKRDLASALSHKKSKDALQIGSNTYIAPYLKDSLLSWSIHSKRLRKNDAEQPYGYRYSDIGFIILKTLVERIANQPLDDFLNQNLYEPMGMNHTTYTPLCKFSEVEIVPTEGNGQFRIGELTGFVNDQNAALLGGVSGHAGLFSNAIDLAKLMQLQLQLGSYGGTTYLYPETILNFARRQYVNNRRGLGWDKPSSRAQGPTSGLASPKTIGHTGFTGTAVWADPDHQLIFVFLSNRVYPDAGNFKLNELNIRTRVHNLIYEAIDYND